jgi:putative peptidoglycan lipid II flippase
LTALTILSQNFGVITGILLAQRYPSIGIYGPTYGLLGGALLNLLLLWPGIATLARRRWFAWDLADPNLRAVIRLLLPNGLSATVNYGGAVLDTAFASLTRQLVALPAIYNAALLANLPVTLLGQAVGLATFPRIAQQAEAGEWSAMRRQVSIVLLATMSLSLVAIAALYLFGRPAIRLLFEHGQFDAAASDVTHAALMIYMLSLPMHVGTEILSRGLIAMRDTRTPLFTNVGQLLGRGLIMAFFVYRLGLLAIPLAFATSSSLETLVLGFIFMRKLQQRLRLGAAEVIPSVDTLAF